MLFPVIIQTAGQRLLEYAEVVGKASIGLMNAEWQGTGSLFAEFVKLNCTIPYTYIYMEIYIRKYISYI